MVDEGFTTSRPALHEHLLPPTLPSPLATETDREMSLLVGAMTSEARKPRLNTKGPRCVPVITNSTATASSAWCTVHSRQDRRRLDDIS